MDYRSRENIDPEDEPEERWLLRTEPESCRMIDIILSPERLANPSRVSLQDEKTRIFSESNTSGEVIFSPRHRHV